MSSSPFQCSVAPESCPLPQVCMYEVNNASHVVGTFCGCDGVNGFVGMPDCVTATPATNLLTAFFSLMLVIFTPVLVYNSYLIGKRLWLTRSNKTELTRILFNEVGLVTNLSVIALFSLVMAIILSLAGIAYPQWTQTRQDGARLPYMYRTRSFFLAIAEIVFLSASLLISGTCTLTNSFFSEISN